jgi:sugar phosphate permease
VLTYAFGVLLPAMQHDLGWSRTQLTGAFSLALLVSALAGLLVGPLLARRSPRLLMTGGAVAAAVLVAAWSRVQTVAVRSLARLARVAPHG